MRLVGKAGGMKPPSPEGLIKKVMGVNAPTRELRSAGLLGKDTRLIPESMRGSTADERWETSYVFDYDSMDPQEFWNRGRGVDAENLADSPVNPMTSDHAPAPITLNPTSSIYPPRPRTVAAGYDLDREVLTVVFRDGTLYNYYGVDQFTWMNFKRAHSKGRFIRLYLDGKSRGAAFVDPSSMPREYVEALYRTARTAQVAQQGAQIGQDPKSRRRKEAWKQSSYYRRGYARPY